MFSSKNRHKVFKHRDMERTPFWPLYLLLLAPKQAQDEGGFRCSLVSLTKKLLFRNCV